jgi:hypothetical protein
MTVVRPSLPPLVATTAAVAEAQAIGPPAADGDEAAMITDSTVFWEAKEDTGRGVICGGGGGGGGEGTIILVRSNNYVADEEARIGGGQEGGWERASMIGVTSPTAGTAYVGDRQRSTKRVAAWNGHSGAVL